MISSDALILINQKIKKLIQMRKQFATTLIVILAISFFVFSCKKNENAPSSSEKIENSIKMVFDSIIANTHVPGLVAGIWAPNEGIDFVYAAGVSNIETNAPMDAEMIFRIGSNTKTMTITVLLQLVDEGLISLDDKLSDYLPDFPRANEVTIEMLTNMRSGIFNYSEDEEFMGILMVNPNHIFTLEDIINFASGKEYYFDPGTGFHYSNTNTFIIAQIIENITGKSTEENITNRLL
jgi:D-alanyl-D-alanine carboxypeptidase